MRSLRIVIFVSVIGLVCTPFLITRSHAERSASSKGKLPNITREMAKSATLAPAPAGQSQQQSVLSGPRVDAAAVDPAVYARLGLGPQSGSKAPGVAPASGGLPTNMSAAAPFSAAIATNVAKGFIEADTFGDWDGKEDDTADHSGKVMDASSVSAAISSNPSFFLTRNAFSEHTIANGFAEDIFYEGDSLGNVYVASTTNITNAVPTPTVLTINLPTVLNAFGTLNSNDTVVITGMAVSPVCDLGSFSAVNGAFAPDFPAGTIGEILYVSFEDTGGGLRLTANGTLIRSGVIAFPISDTPTPGAASPPGRLSANPFPVTVGGSFGVAFSVYSNLAGVAVDDDGSIYLQQVDLTQFTGGNIVKITSKDTPGVPGVTAGYQDRSLATSGFFTFTTLLPTNGQYGTSSGPALQVNVATDYSGPFPVLPAPPAGNNTTALTFFGNVISLATGPGNVVYAAMARSLNPGDSAADQATEGLFQNPASLGPTPAMIISFADAKGSFDNCSTAQNPVTGAYIAGSGVIPVADGIADPVAGAGTPTWKAFVLGNGPDTRAASGTNAVVFGTTTNTLKLDMLIDYSVYSGVAVDEEGSVYVISGGAPSGVGNNPSSNRGEILKFEDNKPGDRRADYIDFRGDQLPSPPASGGNVGDGDSDRFDHIFMVAPMDPISLTPAGLSGLSRGFLRYTNRLAPTGLGVTVAGGSLGQTGGARVLGDDDTTSAPIVFELLDPSHQVAGGDDQVFPFTGDDNDGAGNPVTAGPLNGGFEFSFANPLGDVFTVGTACGVGNGVWNGFFLNSNGNITFGAGDNTNIASDTAFRSGLPKIAPAWADLNPGSRAGGFVNTFPVQAIGFANINAFKIRNINVPEFGAENCSGSNAGSGMTNTFSITLYDDGTGVDENANQPLNPANPIGNNAVPFDLLEGPTDGRWVKEPVTGQLVKEGPRPDGSGFFTDTYARMDLLGTASNPVITGYSIGNQNATNPPGSCEIDLGAAAVTADTGFGNIQGQIEVRWPTFIGDGTEPEIHEFYRNAVKQSVDAGGVVTLAQPDFDLRFEGNGDATPIGQISPTDVNRDRVGFNGTTCQLPSNPQISLVLPGPFVTTPGTSATSLINAYAPVTINLLGTGFFANETTTVCPASNGDAARPDTVVPPRPAKTVSTAVTVTLDTNGDGVPDLPVVLTNITPVNENLVTAVAAPLPNASGTGPGSPWPFLAGGGRANTVTATTTFTKGDNNIFNLLVAPNAFTRVATANMPDMGARAPVVVGSSPANGDSSIVQNLTISGFDFSYSASTNDPVQPTPPACCVIRPFLVTGVFAVQRDNPANVIQATTFNVLNNTTVTAAFNFASAASGKQFLIFAKNAAGNSRNALAAPGGASPNGNEQGNLVLFTVVDTTPPVITCPANITTSIAAGSSTPVSYTVTATDNIGTPTVTCDKPSGSSFNLGTTNVTCTATDTGGNTASCGFTVTVNAINSISLSSANYSVGEAGPDANITLTRTGDTAGAASVGFATSDTAGLQNCNVFNGKASQRCDYTLISTTVQFAPGASSATVAVPIIDDSYAEGAETFTVTLANPVGASLGAQTTATVTINDNDAATGINPIDGVNFFVRQQYLDFLMREPDTPGFNTWVALLNGCVLPNTSCDRIHVSEAFVRSAEFFDRGYFIFRFYPVSFAGTAGVDPTGFGRKPTYAEFMPDYGGVAGFLDAGQLEAAKVAFIANFMARPAFVSTYGALSNTSYVDTLLNTAGVAGTFPAATRTNLINGLNASTLTRAQVLRQIVESSDVSTKYMNEAIVVMQYFGYLRRDPDSFYLSWLTFLNANPSASRTMVDGFMNSLEYRQRFGP